MVHGSLVTVEVGENGDPDNVHHNRCLKIGVGIA